MAAGLRTYCGDRRPGDRADIRGVRPRADGAERGGSSVPQASLAPTVVGLVLDAHTDWSEVAELVTESYCLLAPKKLVALMDRPTD